VSPLTRETLERFWIGQNDTRAIDQIDERSPSVNTVRKATALALAVLGAAIIASVALGAPQRTVFRTPTFPGGITPAFGSIWVTGHRSGVMYRIDPKTNRKVASIDIADSLCGDPIVGAGMLWVSGCNVGAVPYAGITTYEVNPKTNAVVRRIPGGVSASGAGSVWAVSGTSILRIDPRSGVVLAKIHVPGANPAAITGWNMAGVADGSAWALTDKTLVRISTATNTVTKVIPLPDLGNPVFATGLTSGSNIAVLDGKVWVAQYPGLYEIDPRTNVATYTGVTIGPFSQDDDDPLIAANGSLWTRTTDAQIVQLAPNLKVQHRYPAESGGGGGSIAIAFGSLWVTNAGSDTTWREPLT
jgi:hypothetical protein